MTRRTRRTTFLQQLNRIARRAHRWAIATSPQPQPYHVVTRHIGRAY